jgi:hypothetical protein
LIDSKDQSIHTVKDQIIHVFDQWQGTNKQMDDVLFVGIEF